MRVGQKAQHDNGGLTRMCCAAYAVQDPGSHSSNRRCQPSVPEGDASKLTEITVALVLWCQHGKHRSNRPGQPLDESLCVRNNTL